MTNPEQHIRALDLATDGEVWLLERTWRAGSRLTSIANAYLDPYAALHDLAKAIRPRWAQIGDQRGLPATPPADDNEAVAMFFRNPYPHDHPLHETYSLTRVDVCARRAALRQREHVIVQAYGELLCVCGNTPDNDGFFMLGEDGSPDDDSTTGLVGCWSCGRVIEHATGAVLRRYDKCHHCPGLVKPHPVDAVSFGGQVPFINGGGMWAHLADGKAYIACGGQRGTVAAPDDFTIRQCQVCCGDGSDSEHRLASQHGWKPGLNPTEAATRHCERALYISRVTYAIHTGNTAIAPWLTKTCTECSAVPAAGDSDHVTVAGYVVIGCEGFQIVNPNALGIGTAPNWQDWRVDEQERINEAAQVGINAFWQAVTDHLPHIRTDEDLDPCAVVRLEDAARASVADWIDINTSEGETK